MTSFAAALRMLNEIKAAGVVHDYALGEAMALVFWTEPIATYDLDVFVALPPQSGSIVSLSPLYDWASQRGWTAEAEHIMVEGVPVQFLPSHNELCDEAIATARTLDYEGVPVRVIRPESIRQSCARSFGDSNSKNRRSMAIDPSRPAPELLYRLYRDKLKLHSMRATLPLSAKVAAVLELQRATHALLQRQRPLQPWERPWAIEP